MANKFYRGALILVALGGLVGVPMLNAEQSPAGNVKDAIKHAKEAVDHGKQGHAEAWYRTSPKTSSRSDGEREERNLVAETFHRSTYFSPLPELIEASI